MMIKIEKIRSFYYLQSRNLLKLEIQFRQIMKQSYAFFHFVIVCLKNYLWMSPILIGYYIIHTVSSLFEKKQQSTVAELNKNVK